MEKKKIWLLAIIIAIFLLLCCCLFILFSAGGYAVIKNTIDADASTSLITPQYAQEKTPITLPTLRATQAVEVQPPSESSQPGNLAPKLVGQMDQIQSEVEAIRGLPPAAGLERKTLSVQELRARVMDDFFVDYSDEEVKNDTLILSMFGFISPNFDLYTLLVELYSEQIAGFYDDQTQEMVVVQGEDFKGPERMTYAHEYTHALQDAAYDLDEGLQMNDEYCQFHSEACAAVQALVEGDASFSEQQWFLDYSSAQDKKDVRDFYKSYSSPVYDAAPQFLQKDFIFPYSQGLEFVQALYDRGGYASIDAAFLNPPQSTEQILHPQLYPQELPLDLQLPDYLALLGDNWEEIDRNSLGEWYWFLLLNQPVQADWALAQKDAQQAAAGWGGDQYAVYYNAQTDQAALIALSEWDSVAEADEFWAAFTRYAQDRWGKAQQKSGNKIVWEGNDQAVILSRQGSQVLWVQTPSLSSAQALAKTLPDFP